MTPTCNLLITPDSHATFTYNSSDDKFIGNIFVPFEDDISDDAKQSVMNSIIV